MSSRTLRWQMALLSLAALASVLVGPGSARAQGAAASLIGLPLVAVEGGWARYSAKTEMGEVPLVVRVGEKERFKGRSGRWFRVEIEVPEIGRTTFEYLIEGKIFLPKSLLKVRTSIIGQEPSESSDDLIEEEGIERLITPKAENAGEQKVGGKTVKVVRHTYAQQELVVYWSAQVPGFGLVSVESSEPMKLVDFGVGGDPWNGMTPKVPESMQQLAKDAAKLPPPPPPATDSRP